MGSWHVLATIALFLVSLTFPFVSHTWLNVVCLGAQPPSYFQFHFLRIPDSIYEFQWLFAAHMRRPELWGDVTASQIGVTGNAVFILQKTLT